VPKRARPADIEGPPQRTKKAKVCFLMDVMVQRVVKGLVKGTVTACKVTKQYFYTYLQPQDHNVMSLLTFQGRVTAYIPWEGHSLHHVVHAN